MSEERKAAAPKFISIWTHQWMLEDGVKAQEAKGALLMRADRLTHNFNEAVELGFARGEQAGRRQLRLDIEAGEVPPIKPIDKEGV